MKTELEIIKNMGLSWTIFRIKYEIEKKAGFLKSKYPAYSLEEIKLTSIADIHKPLKILVKDHLRHSFFSPKLSELNTNSKELRADKVISVADDIVEKKFVYFSKHTVFFEDINWHYNPQTKKESPKIHWSDIGDLSNDFGDIKWIWELSRFSFVYPLVRAFSLTNDEKYVSCFWEMFEDFIEYNPPELGANYKCGQEMSLRVMAWIFGLNIFIDSPETTEERLELLVKAIHHHADHVDKHFDFALKSVKNNHSLTEAAGMYTVGVAFPFLHSSKIWREKGKRFIQSEANWQIYSDGSYIQHSFNYQRLAIQDLTWFLRLAQINQDYCNQDFKDKFKKTVEFMYQFQEPLTGRLPNYGMNDGAYIHPLTSSDYLDYRPVLQAAWLCLTGERLYEEVKNDEIAIWLGLDTKCELNTLIRTSNFFSEGGYGVLRNENQFAMIRCASYNHRPAQADMLHVDFWDAEHNILADAGTFSYNTIPEEALYFNGTASHNTIMINHNDQMKKASRFIWLNWTKSKVLNFKSTNDFSLIEGEHYGYGAKTHRRGVLQAKDTLVIIDDLIGDFNNDEISLSWLFGVSTVNKLSDFEWEICLPDGTSWIMQCPLIENEDIKYYKGTEKPIAGWKSLYYGYKEAAPQLVLSTNIDQATRYITVLQKGIKTKIIKNNDNTIEVANVTVELMPIGANTIFDDREL